MSHLLEKQKEEKGPSLRLIIKFSQSSIFCSTTEEIGKIPDVFAVFNYMVTPVASLTQLCQYREEGWEKCLLAMTVFWKTLRIF